MATLEFVHIDNSGVHADNISTIHAALIDEYRSIYGSDIDLSTGTADNVFIETMTQLIWNMCQAVVSLYTNMNVSDASGVYLDNLCNLSNVVRQQATASIASLVLTNLTGSNQTFTDLQLLDKNNETWTVEGTITIPANGTLTVQAVCDRLGPVKAPAGWIYTTVELLDVGVNQGVDAIPGFDTETDEQLKARKASANGGTGNTVAETLVSALLKIDGVHQAAVFSNNSGSQYQVVDGSTVEPGQVYVMVRCPAVAHRWDIADASVKTPIAQTIFNKLTPGVGTAEYTSGQYSEGDNCQVTMSDNVQGISNADTDINFKFCFGQPFAGYVTILPLDHFTTTTIWTIGQNLINFVNNVYINENVMTADVMNVAYDSDPTFYGRRTFDVVDAAGDFSRNNFFNTSSPSVCIESGYFNDSPTPFTEGYFELNGDRYVSDFVTEGNDFTFRDENNNEYVVTNNQITIGGTTYNLVPESYTIQVD